ncbi:MAG: hypothetical protein K9H12_11615, partial [Bacteroidales bacterium]|nr:hypothetical protein [Bacteroidales bacterium]
LQYVVGRRLTINYGFNILDKSKSNFFIGPKIGLNYLKVDESGTQRLIGESEVYDYSDNYWDSNKIGIGLFLEYDRKVFTDNISIFFSIEPELVFLTKLGLLDLKQPNIIGLINFNLGLKINLPKKTENE